jgi:hypothetical protein
MPEIDRYKPEDRRGIEALTRRTLGTDAAESDRLTWEWRYRRNPSSTQQTSMWVAREGPTVVGYLPTLPVRLSVKGLEVDASWASEPRVAPEREQQGNGEALMRAWDRSTGASLALAPSEATRTLLDRLRFPDSRVLPYLVKPLTRRAVRLPHWPRPLNQIISALSYPFVQVLSRSRPLRAECEPVRRFDSSFTTLWEKLADRFDLAVRRDAAYLNWRYIEPPHVRYFAVALKRQGEVHGYAVYRHKHEPLGRVTMLVDLLTHPEDVSGVKTLLRWVDRAARAEDSDKVRCYALHGSFRRVLRRNGYFGVKSNVEVAVKLNAVQVPRGFYDQTENWHITFGDSDQDR